MGWFDNLNLDAWYKAVTYLGGLIVLLSMTVPIQILSNEIMALLGFGLFFYGIGRWKNIKTHTQPVPRGIVSWQDRNTDFFGLILEMVGIVLVLLASGYSIYDKIL